MTAERRTIWTEGYERPLHYRDLDLLENELSVSMPWYFNPAEWVVGYKIFETADSGSTYLRVTRDGSTAGVQFELMTSDSAESGRAWTGFRNELKGALAVISNRPQQAQAGLADRPTDIVVTISEMIEAGVHFGTLRRHRNPKMGRYVAAERNGQQIIDLRLTVGMIDSAYDFLRHTVAKGGTVMFVGTKKVTRDAVQRSAASVDMPYVNARWPGGMLTNFNTISTRIRLLRELENQQSAGWPSLVTKKERVLREREMQRLNKLVGGVRSMTRLPDALWVVDPRREHLAVKEARSLGIPVVALADTDADPSTVDFLIPGNDDSARSTGLMTSVIGDAIAEGLMQRGSDRRPDMAGAVVALRDIEDAGPVYAVEADHQRGVPVSRPATGGAIIDRLRLEGPKRDVRPDAEPELTELLARVERLRSQGLIEGLGEALTAVAARAWAAGRLVQAGSSIRAAIDAFAAARGANLAVVADIERQAVSLLRTIERDSNA